MATFNDLPDEASPVLTDKVFTGRGSASGAERKPTLQAVQVLLKGSFDGVYAAIVHTHVIADTIGLQAAIDAKQATLVSATSIKTINGASVLGSGNLVVSGTGDVIGPASSVDNTIPLFNSTTGKLLKSSTWKIDTNLLQSPVLPNPSSATVIQNWGGLLTSGGQPGGGNSQVQLLMVRDFAGAGHPTTKITDNWGLLYNGAEVSGVPQYGWNYETVFDTSGAAVNPGNASHETYLINQVVGNDAGSPVGKRLLQWNVGLPNSFATNPTAAAAYNTANGIFPGHVSMIGTLNTLSFSAYNSAQVSQGALTWNSLAASTGLRIISNGGYTFAEFSEWGQRANLNEFAIVGSTASNFSFRNATSGYGSSDGTQILFGTNLNWEFKNRENGDIIFSPNASSIEGLLWLTKGQRMFVGWDVGAPPADSGSKFQVKGNSLFTGGGDTELRIVGGNGPVLKWVSTQMPSGVDLQPDVTRFLLRVNDNFPVLIQTWGVSRFNIHSTNSSYAPFNVGPLATPGTSMARVKHGVATLVAGTVTVTDANITANSRIQLTGNSDGGTTGFHRVSARTASTSFTITSSSGSDTSTVAWLMIEP